MLHASAKVAIKEGNASVQAGSTTWKQEAVFRIELFSVSMVVLRRASYPCASFEPRHETNTASTAVRPTTYLSLLLARTYIQVRHSLLGAENVVCNSNAGTQLRAVREENLKRKWNNIWDERGDNRIEDKH